MKLNQNLSEKFSFFLYEKRTFRPHFHRHRRFLRENRFFAGFIDYFRAHSHVIILLAIKIINNKFH